MILEKIVKKIGVENYQKFVENSCDELKAYETLMTKEERLRSEDMGNYYRVVADGRDLNYDKFFTQGNAERNTLSEFNSNNTEILGVEQVKERLLGLDFIQQQLNV